MTIVPVKIKCSYCGGEDLGLEYVSEWGIETGDINLVFECIDCAKETEIKAIAFEANQVS